MNNQKQLPTLSVVIPVYNEDENMWKHERLADHFTEANGGIKKVELYHVYKDTTSLTNTTADIDEMNIDPDLGFPILNVSDVEILVK